MSRADEMFSKLGFKGGTINGVRGARFIKTLDEKTVTNSVGYTSNSSLHVIFSMKKRTCKYYKNEPRIVRGLMSSKDIPIDITPDIALAICEKMKELGWIEYTEQANSLLTITQDFKKSLENQIELLKKGGDQ